ncbi:hypothetical protein PsorP6_008479 [Peronosclerospora sorghi]|uniref:Uncharacterized protein n=1 Tax=Peronosclerospora sorghi TaxID=230839 RepID=A0ACC0W8M0_9STRA|nr:hypothetical protein PsorP6_008479 [Peronosclerospora sorghi]
MFFGAEWVLTRRRLCTSTGKGQFNGLEAIAARSLFHTSQRTRGRRYQGLGLRQDASLMWAVSTLQYLRELFAKNACRLLNLLSTTSRKARTKITTILQGYYKLLLLDTPAIIQEAVLDCSLWMTNLFATAESECIECSLSNEEDISPAFDVQQPRDRTRLGTPAFDNPTTIQLLKSACEFYIVRDGSLQTKNSELETQLVKLKAELKESFFRAFESQLSLERMKEVSALEARHLVSKLRVNERLQQQITNAFYIPDTMKKESREGKSVGNSNRTGELTPLSRKEEAPTTESVESRIETSGYQKDESPPFPSEVMQSLPQGQQAIQRPIMGPSESTSPTSSTNLQEPILNFSDSEYEQLTKLCLGEEKNDRWYRHALRMLKEVRKHKRHQKNLRAIASEPSFLAELTASAVYKEVDAQQFTLLGSARNLARDGEDSVWYPRALHHLSK